MPWANVAGNVQLPLKLARADEAIVARGCDAVAGACRAWPILRTPSRANFRAA